MEAYAIVLEDDTPRIMKHNTGLMIFRSEFHAKDYFQQVQAFLVGHSIHRIEIEIKEVVE